MNRQQCFNCLDFHNNGSCYQQVKTVSTIQVQTFVLYRKLSLPLKWNASQCQLTAQTFFIDRFQKTRPQRAMDLNGRTNDGLSDFVDLYL